MKLQKKLPFPWVRSIKKHLNNLEAAGSVKCQEVKGNIDAGGSVTVSGNANGDIDAGGSVTVGGNVDGDVDAGGSVHIGRR